MECFRINRQYFRWEHSFESKIQFQFLMNCLSLQKSSRCSKLPLLYFQLFFFYLKNHHNFLCIRFLYNEFKHLMKFKLENHFKESLETILQSPSHFFIDGNHSKHSKFSINHFPYLLYN